MDAQGISDWLSGLAGAHALRFDRESERAEFLATLLRAPCAAAWWAIPADGGLLGDYALLENLLLPAQTQGDGRAGARLRRCLERLEAQGVAPLALDLPLAALSPWQARLAAFLRAVVADAAALVFDDTCYGLHPDEARQAILLHHYFRRYFPFRPSLYISLSEPPAALQLDPANCHHHETALA